MRKFVVSLASVMLALVCSASHADIVYLTASGDVGLITTIGSVSADLDGIQYTSSWSDPFLGSYWTGSSTRVILVDRTDDITASGDTAYTFNPSNLTSPVETKRRVLDGVYSVQAMAGSNNGRSVFFTSGNLIREFSTGDFSLTRSYTYNPKTSEDITAEITGLMTGSNVIYALVQQTNSRDVLLKFDGQLREDAYRSFSNIPLRSEAETISWLSNSRLAIGHEYGVDVCADGKNVVRLLSSDAPVKAVCQDAGDGFYFIEQYESGDIYITTLQHYSSGELSTLFMNTEGDTCRLVRDGDNGIIGVIAGDELLVYSMNEDELLGEYDRASLGGLPVQITMSAVSGDDGKSSSGCSITGMGMMMILLAGMCMLSKRH